MQLDDINDITSNAKKTLRYMEFQTFKKKIILWIVMALLFVMNIFLLAVMLGNHGKLYKVH